MIRSFRHAGLEEFFKTGSKAGIQPAHAKKLKGQLVVLNRASTPAMMNAPGRHLHPLKWRSGESLISGNWRMTFRFEGEDVILVDYRDYH